MKSIEIIEKLKTTQKAVFTNTDIGRIIQKPKKYTTLFIYRLKEYGFIKEIEKGKYALKDSDPFVVASNILYPSYISFASALSYYKLTTQIPKRLEIAAITQKSKIEWDNYTLAFIKLNKKKFFGFRRIKTIQGFIFIAELEKAIIDCLMLPKYCAPDIIDDAINESRDNINKEKLIQYALRININSVLKRAGYLLEKNGINIYKQIKNKLNRKYDKLNPHKRTGEKNKRWRLVV